MNLFGLLIKGIVIGITVSAPVGPVGILCIRRTLDKRALSGFISGLGAASADTLYAIVAVFGIGLIKNFLLDFQFVIRFVGGIFLLYLGAKIFRAEPTEKIQTPEEGELKRDYVSTTLLTLTNPFTIVYFTAAFAGLGISAAQEGLAGSILIILGVMLGATLWWGLLTASLQRFRDRLDHKILHRINKSTGIIIILFSIILLLEVFKIL